MERQQRLPRSHPLAGLGVNLDAGTRLDGVLLDRTPRAQAPGLTALSPRATLDRGYALLKTPSGALITSSQQVKKGDLIEGILASGRMVAQVVGATAPTPPDDQ